MKKLIQLTLIAITFISVQKTYSMYINTGTKYKPRKTQGIQNNIKQRVIMIKSLTGKTYSIEVPVINGIIYVTDITNELQKEDPSLIGKHLHIIHTRLNYPSGKIPERDLDSTSNTLHLSVK